MIVQAPAPRALIALGGFEADARKAITENPDYFVWWYTVKSVGLCVVTAALTFTLGYGLLKRQRCRPRRRA